MWWKKHQRKILVAAVLAAVLLFAFWYGGGSPMSRGWQADSLQSSAASSLEPEGDGEENTPAETQKTDEAGGTEESPQQDDAEAPQPENDVKTDANTEKQTSSQTPPQSAATSEGKKDAYQTDPVPEGKPEPVEPQDTTIGSTAYTCTLSISCATILDHMDLCNPDKVDLVPEDGWILQPTEVTFYEGESVFNVLQRTCKQKKIHMEFENTPIYNSAYIEGIHNLYEFDVGELSGWMYSVNGWFPNYGCSRYQLKDGDVICWVYTCDLGQDVNREAA